MAIEINANEIRNLIHVIDYAFEAGGVIPKGREAETIELQGRLLETSEPTMAINASEVSNIIHVIDYAFEAGGVIPKGRQDETNELQGRLLGVHMAANRHRCSCDQDMASGCPSIVGGTCDADGIEILVDLNN